MADKSSRPAVSPKRTGYHDLFERLGREQRDGGPCDFEPRDDKQCDNRAAATADVAEGPAPPSRSFSPLSLQIEAGMPGLLEQPTPAEEPALCEKTAPTAASATKEVNPANVVVWAMANRIESAGKTKIVSLKKTVRLSGNGLRIQLLHVSGATVLKSVQNHQPFIGASTVTDDAFDQSQALVTTAELFERIASYGIDLKSVYHDPEHNNGVVRILVNGTSEDNAGYAASANVYVFGTADGKFHLAGCKEILVHELGHGYFDHVAPSVNADESAEGKPFHEAFGDLFAALNFANPNISEDIAAFIASTGGTKSKALRVLKNNAKLDPNVLEEHDRSLVYSGMIWSVTEKLATKLGKYRACDLMLGAVAKTPFFVTSRSPSPTDVARAFADGIRAHISDSALQVQALDALTAEAVRRNLMTQDTKLTAAAPNATAQAFQAAMSHVKERPIQATTLAGMARGLPEMQKHRDIGFEVIGDRIAGNVRRITLRALATDDKTHRNVRIEDGLLEVVIVGDSVHAVEGGALTLAKLDFAKREAEAKSAIDKARALARQHLEMRATSDKGAETVSKSFDTLFASENLKAERVFSKGHLCVSLSTMAGDFIVDLASGEVRTRRLMHIYSPLRD